MDTQRISTVTAGFMGGVAFFFDFLQLPFIILGLIPFLAMFATAVSSFIVLIAWLTFSFWFRVKGVRFFSGPRAMGRVALFTIPFLFELLPLPFVDILTDSFPLITVSVLATIILVRREDKLRLRRQRVQMAAQAA